MAHYFPVPYIDIKNIFNTINYKTIMKKTILSLGVAFFAFSGVFAQEEIKDKQEGVMEQNEEAIEQTEEQAEDAVEYTEEKAEDAVEYTEEQTEEAVEQTEEAVEQTKEQTEEAVEHTEEAMESAETAIESGKTKVNFDELPTPIQDVFNTGEYKDMEVVEAYVVEGSAEADVEAELDEGDVETEIETEDSAEATYEIHVKKENETKVLTFNESGEEVSN